ncbi:MAG: META domain-containing protein [Pseudomonadota bacterium]
MRILIAALLLGLTAGHALATADGPDNWAVKGVAPNDVLNIRAAPNSKGALIGTIPHNGDGLVNIDCIGGLTLTEWRDASDAERKASRKSEWCLVGYGRVVGWVAGWYLEEGSGNPAFEGGNWLPKLEGSEWSLRDLAGKAVPDQAKPSMRFANFGQVMGFDMCDRFNGFALTAPGRVIFDEIARGTKNKCLPEKREVSTEFREVMNATRRHYTSDQIMVLFDADYRVLATFTRRETQ